MSNIEKEQQNAVEFLQRNAPEADPIALECYSILENECPEVLFVDCFDLPEEKRDYYIKKHLEIYSKQAERIVQDLPSSVVLSSGMFGGKTTLSFLILDELVKQGKKTELLIADLVGENYITARSYKDGRKSDAVRFGKVVGYEEKIEFLKESDVDVLLLDEFAFLDLDVVIELQEMCFQKGKNLILTGLNANYLGQVLPAFSENSPIIKNSRIEECYSFVPGFCDEKPLGTSTIRYVNLGGSWILDVGLLPLVVSKELTHVVKYAPAMKEHTAAHIFQNYPDLLDKIFYPTAERQERQVNLFERLNEGDFSF